MATRRFATGYARGVTRRLDTGAWRLHSHDKHVTEARSTLVTRAFQTARCPSMHPEREVSGPLFFKEKGRFFCAVFPPAADVVLALVTYPQLFLPSKSLYQSKQTPRHRHRRRASLLRRAFPNSRPGNRGRTHPGRDEFIYEKCFRRRGCDYRDFGGVSIQQTSLSPARQHHHVHVGHDIAMGHTRGLDTVSNRHSLPVPRRRHRVRRLLYEYVWGFPKS